MNYPYRGARNRYAAMKKAGQPAFGGLLAGGAGAGAAAGASIATVVIAVTVVVVTAVAVAVSTGLWAMNVHRIDAEVDTEAARIDDLTAFVDAINSSLPFGNGTLFLDDVWTMAHGPDPTRQFMFNASLIGSTDKRNIAIPDADGIVVLEHQLPTTFSEDAFAVYGAMDNTTRVMFDLSLLAPGALKLFSWPNKNGVVATLEDVISVAGNTSEFLESVFAVLGDPDITQRLMFSLVLYGPGINHTIVWPDCSGVPLLEDCAQLVSSKTLDNSNAITVLDNAFVLQDNANTTRQARFSLGDLTTETIRTMTVPDMSGTLVVTEGAQNISDKTLDSSNEITVRDNGFTMVDSGDPTRQAVFDLGSIAGGSLRIMAVPDLSGTLILNEGAQTLSDKTLGNTNTITVKDTLLTLQDDADTTKQAQFQLSGITTGNTRSYTLVDASGTLIMIDSSNFVRPAVNLLFRDTFLLIVDDGSTTRRVRFEVGGVSLSTTRILSIPDLDGTLALTSGAQTLSDKTIDTTNTITVMDDLFTIEGGLGSLQFNGSFLTAPRVLTVPNKNGVIATLQDVIDVAGNTSVFLDEAFAIENADDTTKRAMFNASFIATGTNRTYWFPNLDGTLVLTDGAQTMSDKTLDNTNEVTLIDTMFTLQDSDDTTKQIAFRAFQVTTGTLRTLTAPNLDGTLALTSGAQTFSDKTLDNTNTITVKDTLLTVQDDADPTKQAQFQLSSIAAGFTRSYVLPDIDGGQFIMSTATQVITGQKQFTSTNLASRDAADATKLTRVGIHADHPTATTYTMQWPNKSGVLATLTDVVEVAGNTSVFLDEAFAIENADDTTKRAMFNASFIDTGTNRTYWFPNLDGTLALTSGAQTFSDKTLDNTNTITVKDTLLTLQDDADPTKTATFQLSSISTGTNRQYTLPNAGGNVLVAGTSFVVGQTTGTALQAFRDTLFRLINNGDNSKVAAFECSGISAATTRTLTVPNLDGTLALTSGAQTFSDKTLDNTNTITVKDTLLTLQDDADTTKQARFQLSSIATGTTRTFTLPDSDQTLVGTTVLQTLTNKILGNTNSFTALDNRFTLQDQTDTTKQTVFQLSGITTGTTRTLTVPDASGTIALTSGAQTLSTKTLDNTNAITVKDNAFTIQDDADASKQVVFQLSSVTTGNTRTLTAPNLSGTMALNFGSVGCFVAKTGGMGTQTIPTGLGGAYVTFSTGEAGSHNADGNFASGSTNYTAPIAGHYAASTTITYGSITSSTGIRSVLIEMVIAGTGTYLVRGDQVGATVTQRYSVSATITDVLLTAGSVIRVLAQQTQGSDATLLPSASSTAECSFSVRFLGP